MEIQKAVLMQCLWGWAGWVIRDEVEMAGWDAGMRRGEEAGPTGGCWLVASCTGTREE